MSWTHSWVPLQTVDVGGRDQGASPFKYTHIHTQACTCAPVHPHSAHHPAISGRKKPRGDCCKGPAEEAVALPEALALRTLPSRAGRRARAAAAASREGDVERPRGAAGGGRARAQPSHHPASPPAPQVSRGAPAPVPPTREACKRDRAASCTLRCNWGARRTPGRSCQAGGLEARLGPCDFLGVDAPPEQPCGVGTGPGLEDRPRVGVTCWEWLAGTSKDVLGRIRGSPCLCTGCHLVSRGA